MAAKSTTKDKNLIPLKFTPSYGPLTIDEVAISADGLVVEHTVPVEALIRIIEHKIGKDGDGLRFLKRTEAMVALNATRELNGHLSTK